MKRKWRNCNFKKTRIENVTEGTSAKNTLGVSADEFQNHRLKTTTKLNSIQPDFNSNVCKCKSSSK